MIANFQPDNLMTVLMMLINKSANNVVIVILTGTL